MSSLLYNRSESLLQLLMWSVLPGHGCCDWQQAGNDAIVDMRVVWVRNATHSILLFGYRNWRTSLPSSRPPVRKRKADQQRTMLNEMMVASQLKSVMKKGCIDKTVLGLVQKMVEKLKQNEYERKYFHSFSMFNFSNFTKCWTRLYSIKVWTK